MPFNCDGLLYTTVCVLITVVVYVDLSSSSVQFMTKVPLGKMRSDVLTCYSVGEKHTLIHYLSVQVTQLSMTVVI